MKTQKQKDDAWKRYEAKVNELGYDDNYGHNLSPSIIKQRISPNTTRNEHNTYYKGDDHDELWGMDLSGEELLEKLYGEDKKKHDRT